jgi:hypothetical protein
MMYQMATGKLPFPGTSFGEVLIGHLQIPPTPPREYNPEVPEAYEAIILKCLAKKQEERFQSMSELHDAILAVMESLGISRELPVADATELAAASGGTKTKSSPGTTKTPTKALPKPALPKRTPQQPLRATPQPQMTVAQPAPPAPLPRSRVGLMVGIGVGALVVIGVGVAFVVQQQAAENRHAAEEAAKLAARHMAEEVEAKRKADEEAVRKAESERIVLSVISEPVGATVEATWKDGAKASVTPIDIQVPRNTKVHFAFSKKDYLPSAQDVVAEAPQVVKAVLSAEPRAAPPPRPTASRTHPDETGKKAKPASSDQQTDSIPVEF